MHVFSLVIARIEDRGPGELDRGVFCLGNGGSGWNMDPSSHLAAFASTIVVVLDDSISHPATNESSSQGAVL